MILDIYREVIQQSNTKTSRATRCSDQYNAETEHTTHNKIRSALRNDPVYKAKESTEQNAARLLSHQKEITRNSENIKRDISRAALRSSSEHRTKERSQ